LALNYPNPLIIMPLASMLVPQMKNFNTSETDSSVNSRL